MIIVKEKGLLSDLEYNKIWKHKGKNLDMRMTGIN